MKIRVDRGYWTIEGNTKYGAGLHVGEFSLFRALWQYWKLSR